MNQVMFHGKEVLFMGEKSYLCSNSSDPWPLGESHCWGPPYQIKCYCSNKQKMLGPLQFEAPGL